MSLTLSEGIDQPPKNVILSLQLPQILQGKCN